MTQIELLATKIQREILRSPARIKVVVASRRWGKTVCSGLWLVVRAYTRPQSNNWYLAHSYGRALRQMRVMRRAKGFRPYVRHAYAQFPPRIELFNDAEIAFRSTDRPDNLLGEGLWSLVLDEAARQSETIWHETLLPMLSDTDGSAMLPSTYCGQNWFYDLAERGKRHTTELATWVCPWQTALVFQGEAGFRRLSAIKAQMPAVVFDQEYNCIPSANRYAAFRAGDLEASARAAVGRTACPGRVIGYDIGRTRDHPGLVCMDANGLVIEAEQLPLDMPYRMQAEHLRRRATALEANTVIVDTTGGGTGGHAPADAVLAEFRRVLPRIHECTWDRRQKRVMVEALCVDLEARPLGVFISDRYTVLQRQLSVYEARLRGFYYEYGAPDGEHDDTVSALLMANWARRRGLISTGGSSGLAGLY